MNPPAAGGTVTTVTPTSPSPSPQMSHGCPAPGWWRASGRLPKGATTVYRSRLSFVCHFVTGIVK